MNTTAKEARRILFEKNDEKKVITVKYNGIILTDTIKHIRMMLFSLDDQNTEVKLEGIE